MSRSAKAPKAAKSPRSAKPYHKGNVAADLFAAASRLVESEGLDGLTLRRLCREVGVTAANFYNHYPSLDYLLLDVAAAGHESLQARVSTLLKRIKSRAEQLVTISTNLVEFGVDHPDLFRLMFGQVQGAEAHERYRQAADRGFALLVTVIYGGDIYRSDDISWSHTHCRKAYAHFSFSYGLARVISMGVIGFPSGSKAERQQFVRELVWTFVRGLDEPECPIE
jgi:AcrR family transcriptional regulator